jgi:phosphoribosylaminoimidazole-succinocarboxamide synthase
MLLQSESIGLPLLFRGKVRDVYALDSDRLLFVASDRISAFDCVLATGIPRKGEVLTRLSVFWFNRLAAIVPNHLITADLDAFPASLRPFADRLRGRSMIVRRADMFPVECVARGYLDGSAWKEYQAAGSVCGLPLPPGLRQADALPEPIFTPAIKATTGHDENIPFDHVVRTLGAETAEALRSLTLRLYRDAAAYARDRGIIIADTKFEFGCTDRGIVLADEVLTPDSSRFWPAESYAPGGPQPSYDKQFVRDYLESIRWNKQPPAPALPEDVVRRTSEKYVQAYRVLTGHDLPAGG